MTIDWSSVEELRSDLISWRRHLHMHPELSFHESKTAAWITEKLRLWGIDVEINVGGHGVVGRLSGHAFNDSNKPSKHIALRADIDALPIQDEKEVYYKSRVPGIMHACGHDGHTATLLTVACWLAKHREAWSGNVTLLFQPAEEVNPGGAKGMIESGCLDGIDCVYGIHLWTPIPVGVVASKEGALLASVDEFSIEIHGRGGHAALPHQTVDSIVVAASLVQAFQTIVSRNIDPLDHAVVTIGSMHAGHTFNVIAERANLHGTVRTFNAETRTYTEQRVREMTKHICEMNGAKADITYYRGYPSVINHKDHVQRVQEKVTKHIKEISWDNAVPVMAGEDFAYYLEKVPGCFIFVGAGNAQIEATFPHHHPKFNIDESALMYAVKVFLSLVIDPS